MCRDRHGECNIAGAFSRGNHSICVELFRGLQRLLACMFRIELEGAEDIAGTRVWRPTTSNGWALRAVLVVRMPCDGRTSLLKVRDTFAIYCGEGKRDCGVMRASLLAMQC